MGSYETGAAGDQNLHSHELSTLLQPHSVRPNSAAKTNAKLSWTGWATNRLRSTSAAAPSIIEFGQMQS
jgi:hypothetical protein